MVGIYSINQSVLQAYARHLVSYPSNQMGMDNLGWLRYDYNVLYDVGKCHLVSTESNPVPRDPDPKRPLQTMTTTDSFQKTFTGTL